MLTHCLHEQISFLEFQEQKMSEQKWKGRLFFMFFHEPLYFHLFFILMFLQVCSKFAVAGSAVKFLPGFEGPLPFELETGYIGVDESEDVQLFYYFVKSESNPEVDPLVLWLTGGPGCSTLTALLYEFGPLKFEEVEYNGCLPRLILNANSWTEVASFIFLDFPVGTGFSYARTPEALQSNTLQACNQALEFLRKFLIDHPEFISNPFYVGGDSFSGLIVPIITELISRGKNFKRLFSQIVRQKASKVDPRKVKELLLVWSGIHYNMHYHHGL